MFKSRMQNFIMAQSWAVIKVFNMQCVYNMFWKMEGFRGLKAGDVSSDDPCKEPVNGNEHLVSHTDTHAQVRRSYNQYS